MFEEVSTHKFSINLYFIAFYRSNNEDEVSNALIEFKKGRTAYVSKWIDESVNLFSINQLTDIDFIVRALGHDELISNGNDQLDYLCFRLAENLNAEYLKDLLQKNKKNEPLRNTTNILEREKNLTNYRINNKYHSLQNKKFLIVDDIYTTGATLKSIVNVINENFDNCSFEAFVLGKTITDKAEITNNAVLNDFKIAQNYYDDKEYSRDMELLDQGYLSLGFLKSRHEIFPQEWYYDIWKSNYWPEGSNYFVTVVLLKSKEFFVTELGAFKRFDQTPIVIKDNLNFSFNSKEFLLGSDLYSYHFYFLPKAYKDLFEDSIEGSS